MFFPNPRKTFFKQKNFAKKVDLRVLFFFFSKKILFSTLQSFFLCWIMQSPALSLKFCGALARVASVIVVHATSHMTFHGYFWYTCTKQYSFSGAKDSYPSIFLLMIITSCCKYSKKDV